MLIDDSTGADYGAASDPALDREREQHVARSFSGFSEALGSEHKLTTGQLRQLYDVCAGRLDLAGVVAEVSRTQEPPRDLTDSSFLDYIATLAPEPELELSEGDRCAAVMLSHLNEFSHRTALQVIAALPDAAKGAGARDRDNVLMRLRMTGVVLTDESGQFKVPALLAAVLRLNFEQDPNSDDLALALLETLLDLVEHAPPIDLLVLSDVLSLARRFRSWRTLVKLQESFGLSLYLMVPKASSSAFSGLPADAISAEPTLEYFAQTAALLIDHLGESFGADAARTALADITGPGQLGDRFPGPNLEAPSRSRSSVFTAVPRMARTAQSSSSAQNSTPVVGQSLDYFEVLERIVSCANSGQHVEASGIGLEWSAGSKGSRALLVVRFLTAVSLFHSGQDHRALSILHRIEAAAVGSHVPGDFLLPAVMAWSALVGATSGDSETADEYLARLDNGDWFPLILDELVRPPLLIARALRALALLDVDTARTEYAALVEFPELRSLWVFLPIIGRMIAVMSVPSESGLLFANDSVEQRQSGLRVSAAGKDLMISSRSLVFIALGQLRWAELELEKMRLESGERIVLMVRIELAAGRFSDANSLADTWFYHQCLTPTLRSELAAIKAAALLRMEKLDEAIDEFETAIELCSWVGSLLPLALLPHDDRKELIELSSRSDAWDQIVASLDGHFRNKEELMKRLLTVSAAPFRNASFPQLNSAEAQLLEYLATGYSIAQISQESHQVTGTVKNRLSALYRKFGVSGKNEVLARARSMGFIAPT